MARKPGFKRLETVNTSLPPGENEQEGRVSNTPLPSCVFQCVGCDDVGHELRFLVCLPVGEGSEGWWEMVGHQLAWTACWMDSPRLPRAVDAARVRARDSDARRHRLTSVSTFSIFSPATPRYRLVMPGAEWWNFAWITPSGIEWYRSAMYPQVLRSVCAP